MLDELGRMLAVNGYLPHGYCLDWSPRLVWTFVISDVTIFLSYFSMPAALIYFARRRRDFPYRWLLWLFAAFIMACGSTHLMDVIVLWKPFYGLDALIKALTALTSLVTAVALWPLIPRALRLPSADQWRRANAELQREIGERKRIEGELRLANAAAEVGLQQERALMAAIVESSDDAIVAQSLDGMITSWNQGAQRIFGYSAEEILGQSINKLIPQDHRDDELKELDAIARGELIRNYETERLRKDGSRVDVSVTVSPLRDPNGQIIGASKIARDITARKQAEEKLRESEAHLRLTTEMADIAVWEYDFEAGQMTRSANHDKLYGLPWQNNWNIDTFLRATHPDDRQRGNEMIRASVASGGPDRYAFDFRVVWSDASLHWLWASGQVVKRDSIGQGLLVRGVLIDITQRKAAEAKIERMSRLYAALSQCNQAIVRCTGEEELFPEICRVAVKFGGMKMAWIGLLEPSTRMVRIAASFGDDADEYLQGIEISADADSPYGRGPTGIAMRENQPIWRQDFLSEPRTAPWHERRARFDFRASASLPLHRDGVPAGVLTLYASEVGAFDEAARQLLTEMAADIDFALDNFAREAARERAQRALRAAEEQFRGLVEQSIAGIFIIQDDKLAYVNPRFAEIFGYGSVDELIGRDSLSLVIEKDRSAVRELRRGVEAGKPSTSYSFTAERKDGVLIEVGVHGARATHRGRPAVIGLIQDISEKKRAEERIQHYLKQLQTAFMSTVEVATSLSEMRDPYTAGHERRVGALAAAIGAELGFDAQRVEGLRVAGFLHDIGKIVIPAEILSKPGKLSAVEYQLIQGHPQSGYDVLKDVEFPWPVAQVALQHHERIDGGGYPQGLKGEEILIEARILAVADVVEAMSSHRPYRPGLGIENALAEIERGRGTTYDQAVADACLKMFREDGYAIPA